MKSIRQALYLLCILCACKSVAQSDYLAIRSGYSNTTLNSSSTSDVSINRRSTWHVSLVYTTIMENGRLGFSMEPGYLIKGARINVDTMDYRFNFFSMPLLFDVYPMKNFKISIGPEVGFLISSKNNSSTNPSLSETYDNRWELSGVVGASYPITFFADLGVRYNRSFTKLTSHDQALNKENIFSEYFQIFIILRIAN